MNPLYEVKLVIDEDNDHHYYQIGEDPTFHQGVTGILGVISKYALLPWTAKITAEYMRKTMITLMKSDRFVKEQYMTDKFWDLFVKRSKKQARFVKEKAAQIGSEAHNSFDRCIRKEVDMAEDLPFQSSFAYWLKTEKLKIIQGDSKVGSKIHRYGGSFDAIGVDENGKIWIIDFKTGKNIWDTHAYQVAAYGQAMMETYGLDEMPQGVIVRFEKDKKQYERKEILNMNDSFQTFLNAKALFEAEKRDKFINRELIKEKKVKEKTK